MTPRLKTGYAAGAQRLRCLHRGPRQQGGGYQEPGQAIASGAPRGRNRRIPTRRYPLDQNPELNVEGIRNTIRLVCTVNEKVCGLKAENLVDDRFLKN